MRSVCVPTEAEVEQLFAAAAALPSATMADRFERAGVSAALVLAAECGLRKREITALRVQDVERGGEPWQLRIQQPASTEADYRRFPLEERTQRILAEYLEARAEWIRAVRIIDAGEFFPLGPPGTADWPGLRHYAVVRLIRRTAQNS